MKAHDLIVPFRLTWSGQKYLITEIKKHSSQTIDGHEIHFYKVSDGVNIFEVTG